MGRIVTAATKLVFPPFAKKGKARPQHFESQEQAQVIVWADLFTSRYPELRWLYAIPNAGGFSGGFKANMLRVKRLKASGVKSGVPDLCLPVPRGGYYGLYIEMKSERVQKASQKPKPEQMEWLAGLTGLGYRTACCVGPEAAKAEIQSYLALPKPRRMADLSGDSK